MTVTHCLPSGSAAASQIQVPGINIGSVIAQTGTLKGVLVYLHGMQAGAGAGFPEELYNTDVLLPNWNLLLCQTIAATGWYVIAPSEPGDGYAVGGQNVALYDDIGADSGHGTRLVGTTLEWWDHMVLFIQRTISASVPIVPVGFSWGGWNALQIAIGRTSTIAGYVAHHPASIVSDLNPAWVLETFSDITTTGADVTSSALNGVTSVPGLLGWGSVDEVVGPSPWTADTLTPAIYSAAHGAGAPVTPNCDGTGTTSAGSPAENHVLTSSTDNANPNNDVYRIAAWFAANLPHN